MMSGNAIRWNALGGSVRGASHLRNGLPNQDAWEFHDESPWLLAMADGHGSARSFRSDRGAGFAVKLANEFGSNLPADRNPSTVKQWVEYDLPRELIRRWREQVDANIESEPFSAGEGQILGLKADNEPRARLAYGATLLLIVATDSFIFYLQLGDGDILTVSASGEVTRPLPKDERLIANETTSLCMEKAWEEVRTAFQVIASDPPALILAATDGYANAFRDEASFQQVGTDLLRFLREEGPEFIKGNLENWLNETSEAGSGDDITVGLLYRPDALVETEPDARPAPPETP
jgi:hypothetical protein